MKQLNEKEITFKQFKQTAIKHHKWALLCIIILICLETFFFLYPPRGYIAEDYITIGSIKGQPLISVQRLWHSRVKNDQFMLDVLANSNIRDFENRLEKLEYIDKSLRPNLRFSIVNETIFKISFIQSSTKSIRPFLNTFTKKFIEHAALISKENLQSRRKNAKFSYQQLLRRADLLHRLFSLSIPLEKIIPDKNTGLVNSPADNNESLSGTIGLIAINELNKYLYEAQRMLKEYTDEKQAILALFPFNHKRLTDPETPPKPVQPFLSIFYLFLVIAVFLIYIAGLFYFLPTNKQED